MRVYQLAKQLAVESKELLDQLHNLGVEAKSHMSAIDEKLIEDITHLLASSEAPKERKPLLPVSCPISLSELSAKLKVKPNELIKSLMKEGMMVSINQSLSREIATNLADRYGYQIKVVSLEEGLKDQEEKALLVPRPPIVTIMGHVDHGKTKLLDAVRQSDIVAGEAGGITQHIGAYKVKTKKGGVTFLDTPGHEAFTAMRARGAQVTDIVVLVVAADDGVMPQTREAINHAKAANVPIVVAVNKIDLETANPERVKKQLADLDLLPEEWGGKTILVEISAKEKLGLDNLLEMLLLEAEMLELKGNPTGRACGIVIEARLDRGRGAVGTVLVQKGTLKIGDPFVAGKASGKVRAMFDDKGRQITEASVSTPVEVLGFSKVAKASDPFIVVQSEKEARQISLKAEILARQKEKAAKPHLTLDDLYKKKEEIKELKLIIKTDVDGSSEALSAFLEKLSTDEVKIKTIHTGTGGIAKSDVMLADASDAIIVGFNVQPQVQAKKLAEKVGVDIRLHKIIYEAVLEVKQALEGLLEPEIKETILGYAEVRETFKITKIGAIAGCFIKEGKAVAKANARLIREEKIIYDTKISSLRRFKEDVSQVLEGLECGIVLENFQDIKKDDLIQIYKIEEIARKL